MNVTLYVQETCSKSNKVEQLLRQLNISLSVIDIFKNPPTPEKLIELAEKCGEPLTALLRKDTTNILDLEINIETCSELELAVIMSKYPEIIERPIAENGHIAVVARPPDKILSFIK